MGYGAFRRRPAHASPRERESPGEVTGWGDCYVIESQSPGEVRVRVRVRVRARVRVGPRVRVRVREYTQHTRRRARERFAWGGHGNAM